MKQYQLYQIYKRNKQTNEPPFWFPYADSKIKKFYPTTFTNNK